MPPTNVFVVTLLKPTTPLQNLVILSVQQTPSTRILPVAVLKMEKTINSSPTLVFPKPVPQDPPTPTQTVTVLLSENNIVLSQTPALDDVSKRKPLHNFKRILINHSLRVEEIRPTQNTPTSNIVSPKREVPTLQIPSRLQPVKLLERTSFIQLFLPELIQFNVFTEQKSM